MPDKRDLSETRERLEDQARKEGLSLMQEESVHTLHDSASLATQRRQKRHPLRLAIWTVVFLVAVLVPYALGRWIAIYRTKRLVNVLAHLTPRGLALLGWMNVTLLGIAVVVAIISRKYRRPAIIATLVLFVCEQFVAGIALLKWNFWNSTYVVFHSKAIYANAINLGILSSIVAVFVFCIVYIVLLVFIRPGSSADFLTTAPAALSEYLVIELGALLVVLFGGLLTMIG